MTRDLRREPVVSVYCIYIYIKFWIQIFLNIKNKIICEILSLFVLPVVGCTFFFNRYILVQSFRV